MKYKISSDGTTAVGDHEYYPITDETPRNAKMLLINDDTGCVVIGRLKDTHGMTHWYPMPKRPKIKDANNANKD